MLNKLNMIKNLPYKNFAKFKYLDTNKFSKRFINQNFSQNNNHNDSQNKYIMTNEQKNIGKRHFLKNIYHKTGLGIMTALTTAGCLTYLAPDFLASNSLALPILGCIGSFGSLYFFKDKDYKVKEEYHSGTKIPVAHHSFTNKLAYATLSMSNGCMIAPAVLSATIINPLILPTAIVLSSCTMIGASYYALKQKNTNIESWGPTLYGTLTGMVGMGLLSLLMYPILPEFAEIWFSLDTYIGIVLFS